MPGKIVNTIVKDKQLPEETIRVNLSRKKIKLLARLFKYRDKDTRQIIYYIPSLEITGYGATDNKAKEMLDFSIDEYFSFLISLSYKKLEEELLRLGWHHVPYANKEFSKVYISSDGELQNFNAVADHIEELTVEV